MPIDAVPRQWIRTLATLFLSWRERMRERQAITVAFDQQQLVIRDSGGGHGDGPAGQPVAAETLRAARNGFVILELPSERMVMRSISVPAQAAKFLAGVVHNQIDRLSPWPVDNLVYGFDTRPAEDNATVDVRILMASRTDLDAARDRLAVLGLQADRVVARHAGDDTAAPLALWSRATDASGDHLADAMQLVTVSIGAAVALTLAVSLWALVSTAAVRSESADLAARAKSLQQKLQLSRAPAGAAAPPAQRAWLDKENAIAAVIVLEALSRALPASAYLTEIRLEGATLRLTGLATDVPGLLAPLEQSGHLTGVHFSAPATRAPDGKSFRFSIEAQVTPHIAVAEQ